MSKYKVSGDYDEVDVNVWIANELAEANRLKILELKILLTTKMGQCALNATIFDEEKEVVDKA